MASVKIPVDRIALDMLLGDAERICWKRNDAELAVQIGLLVDAGRAVTATYIDGEIIVLPTEELRQLVARFRSP